jgi:uncharacterized protein with von Willebrand factor type A (vWA) domain
LQWEKWWKETAGRFELRPLDDKAPRRVVASDTVATYFNIPLNSRRVVFCLDVSASMAQPIGSGGMTRLDEAKRELAKVFERTDSSVMFNLVFFDNTTHPFNKRLVKATDKEKEKAIAFVKQIGALGGTNLYEALELGFADGNVDTVYLLTDGEPSAGKIRNPDVLLAEVARWNKTRQVVIHCIAVGRDSGLLRMLARQSGGAYVLRM